MRRVVILGLALSLMACGNDATAPSVSLNGSYSLRTINGSSLPYTFSGGLTLVSDQLTLNPDGSYSDFTQYSDGTISTQNGFYSEFNGSIQFNDQTDHVTFQGSLSGSVLTEITPGFTQAYEKN